MDSKETAKEEDPPVPNEDDEGAKVELGNEDSKEDGAANGEKDTDTKDQSNRDEARSPEGPQETVEKPMKTEEDANATEKGEATKPKEETPTLTPTLTPTPTPTDEPKETKAEAVEGDGEIGRERPQELATPAKLEEAPEEPKQEPPGESEMDPNAAYQQQMHYGYHPGMQHHPPPPYYGGYYPPPPPHAYYPPPPPPMDQEQGGGGMGSPGPEGMHHYYPPPPPPYGYPPQHHYVPYPPASPVKSPGGSRDYPSQHQSYFPAMTPPRYNHEHEGGAHDGVDHGPKKDEEMKAGDALEQQSESTASAPDANAGTHKASKLKVYVKPKGLNIPPEVLERRSRKNANSRARASKHRARVVAIEQRPQSEWTEEEQKIIDVHYKRRNQKNDRSRERALEKKAEIDRILGKPEGERTKLEMQFLENALGARSRKNEGDRIRRRKLKELGVAHIGRNHKQYTSLPSPSKGGAGHYAQQQQQFSGYPPPPYGYGGYPPPPPPHYGMMGPPASPYRGYPPMMGGGDAQHPGYPPPPEGGDPYAPTNPPPPPGLPHLIPGEGQPIEGPPPPPGSDRPGGPPPE